MKRIKIQVNELNKLYDEVYYSNLSDIEGCLEIITHLITEKEYDDFDEEIKKTSDVIDVIISVLDEVGDAFDNDGLNDAYDIVKEKIDKIQSGELDDLLEMEYIKQDDEDLEEDDFDENDDYQIIDEDDNEEYDYMDEYDEY